MSPVKNESFSEIQIKVRSVVGAQLTREEQEGNNYFHKNFIQWIPSSLESSKLRVPNHNLMRKLQNLIESEPTPIVREEDSSSTSKNMFSSLSIVKQVRETSIESKSLYFFNPLLVVDRIKGMVRSKSNERLNNIDLNSRKSYEKGQAAAATPVDSPNFEEDFLKTIK